MPHTNAPADVVKLENMDSFKLTVAKENIILIDGDNVRGKTSFSISKFKLLEDLLYWASHFEQRNKFILYYDHGVKQEAFYLEDVGIVVAFSGRKKTDDIIARDIVWFQNSQLKRLVVVTEDLELKQRCKRAISVTRLSKKKAKKKSSEATISPSSNASRALASANTTSTMTLSTISSPTFVSMLYDKIEGGKLRPVLRNWDEVEMPSSSSSRLPQRNDVSQDLTRLYQQELQLTQQRQSLERLISHARGRANRKTLMTLKRQQKVLCSRLQRFYESHNATLQSISPEEKTPGLDDGGDGDPIHQEEVFRRGVALLSPSRGQDTHLLPPHCEETWQRVVFAEEMRKAFAAVAKPLTLPPALDCDGLSLADVDSAGREVWPSRQLLLTYVNYYNSHATQ